MHSTPSEKIIESLERIFMIHGLQLSVTSDNGPQFVSRMFERYLEGCGIEHSKTTPLCPQTNGEVERQDRSLLKRMQIAHAEANSGRKKFTNT